MLQQATVIEMPCGKTMKKEIVNCSLSLNSKGANITIKETYMKITTYQQLNELVAKELGYYFKEDEEGYDAEWYSPNKELIGFPVYLPKFSTNYSTTEELLDYLCLQGVGVEIWKRSGLSLCNIHKQTSNGYNQYSTWKAWCGDVEDCDIYINSIPLARCLAFLKYKGIEVGLERELV